MTELATHPLHRTPLHAEHVTLGAKMTDFHGWDMPLYYTSILDEHAAVRQAVGLFDISHMGQVWVSGPGAVATLNDVTVSDIANVGEGRACYTMMLNERGGILDDVIVYHLTANEYVVIVNCANRAKDVEWLRAHQQRPVVIDGPLSGRCIVAVQGPLAARLLDQVLEARVSGMGRFDVWPVRSWGDRAWVARTGYTGSAGFELFLDAEPAMRIWRELLQRGKTLGIHPIGLGARDTLRLEAGLRLYGVDMDETTTPYEADLGWTVAIHKAFFIGQPVLVEQQTRGVEKRLVGFTLGHSPIPRHDCSILVGDRQVGGVTSGTFSAMLDGCIGMGYVERAVATPGIAISVVIRNKPHPGTIVKLPFWRKEEKPR